MTKSNDCDQSNVMVLLKKIDRLEHRVHQLELDKEHIYEGLEKLYEKIEEFEIKIIES